MGSLGSLAVGVAAVCLPAALPVLVVMGRQWVSLFLVPAAGALLVGLAAVVTVGLGLSLVVSWAAVGALVNVLALGWRARGGRPLGRQPVEAGALVASLLGAGTATAWASSQALSWDVHSFWYSRGRWFLEGPDYLRLQLASPYTSPYPGPPHAQYPPVPSATPGLMWQLTGDVDYFAAKLLLAGVTASVLVLLALGVARVVRSPRWLAWAGALLVPPAALYFATASSALGHQDLTYAAAGEAALVYGLLLPRRRAELATSMVLCVLCGLVKNEGFVVAVMVAGLVSLRHCGLASLDHPRWRSLRPPAGAVRRFVLLVVPWLALVGSWRAVLVLRVGASGPEPAGRTQADELADLRPLPSPEVGTLLHLGATHLWWFAGPVLLGALLVLLAAGRDRQALRPMAAALGAHALVVVPLLAATGVVLTGGPGLPWDELVLRTARYVTFSRLAMTVCLLVVAATAIRVARGAAAGVPSGGGVPAATPGPGGPAPRTAAPSSR